MDMIYQTKTLPEKWKVARIIPLHKKELKMISKTIEQYQTSEWHQRYLKNAS